jgi:excisionase family DNA binding protein
MCVNAVQKSLCSAQPLSANTSGALLCLDHMQAITVKVVAARLGVSAAVVRRMITRRQLTGHRVEGVRVVRVDADEVERLARTGDHRYRSHHPRADSSRPRPPANGFRTHTRTHTSPFFGQSRNLC